VAREKTDKDIRRQYFEEGVNAFWTVIGEILQANEIRENGPKIPGLMRSTHDICVTGNQLLWAREIAMGSKRAKQMMKTATLPPAPMIPRELTPNMRARMEMWFGFRSKSMIDEIWAAMLEGLKADKDEERSRLMGTMPEWAKKEMEATKRKRRKR